MEPYKSHTFYLTPIIKKAIEGFMRMILPEIVFTKCFVKFISKRPNLM